MKSAASPAPAIQTQASATNHRTLRPASRPNIAAAIANRTNERNSGVNPESAPLVTTGVNPHKAAERRTRRVPSCFKLNYKKSPPKLGGVAARIKDFQNRRADGAVCSDQIY